jgi:hypothetical protein
LHWAVKLNHYKTSNYLIENGAHLSIQDFSGSTALHYACFLGIPEMVSLLVCNGCDTNLLDCDNKLPMDILKINHSSAAHSACATILHRHTSESPMIVSNLNTTQLSYRTTKTSSKDTMQFHTQRSTSSPKPFVVGIPRIMHPYLTSPVVRIISHPPPREIDTTPQIDLHSESDTFKGRIEAFPLHSPANLNDGSVSVSIHGKRMKKTSLRHKLPSTLNSTAGRPTSPKPFKCGIAPPSPQQLATAISHKKPVVIPPPILSLYLPARAAPLDVFVTIELCSDCHLHDTFLWHEEEKYSQIAIQCFAVVLFDLKEYCNNLRVYGVQIKYAEPSRIGAFEVSISVKMSQSILLDENSKNSWVTKKLFSKLETQR